MRIHFWGVRGSIPTPLSPLQIQNRIAAVVQRISARDIESADTREKFLASLPQWLFGTVGGNTSCVEVETSSGETIILDAGSGIRELSLNLRQRPSHAAGGNTYHILFSHFHWDHLQGLPFFSQGFDPRDRIIFYSVRHDLPEILGQQMSSPYFPVPMQGPGGFRSALEFVHLQSPDCQFKIGSSLVRWHEVNHPGGCVAYMIQEGGKKFIYATDTELTRENFIRTSENTAFFADADVLVMDSQYTMGEALEKTGWGHSAFSMTVDFALNWNVKKLVLFHHEPTYTDQKIFTLKQSADWYREYAGPGDLEIMIAREDQEIHL
ncbi:MAG TPA: MBL fold metallo-hydrolase [Treponemataceae bacterium]|nr:MBL fold metallo-hydrolase [Treponemataceae bacterium]